MPERDLKRICEATDRTLELVHGRRLEPIVGDWNDRLLVEAFKRAHRCLPSIRELAGRKEAEDAAVLTRALVSLILQYLWLISAGDEQERRDRLRRLQRKWANERATLGEELDDLAYFPVDGSEEQKQFRNLIGEFRAKADELEREGVRRVPGERDIAKRLDGRLRTLRSTESEPPSAAWRNKPRPTSTASTKKGAAEALRLGLVTFAALLGFANPILQHDLGE